MSRRPRRAPFYLGLKTWVPHPASPERSRTGAFQGAGFCLCSGRTLDRPFSASQQSSCDRILSVPPVGPWRSWERASMASRRSWVRTPSAPPIFTNIFAPAFCLCICSGRLLRRAPFSHSPTTAIFEHLHPTITPLKPSTQPADNPPLKESAHACRSLNFSPARFSSS
jgi:hypothetical protein